MDRRDFLRPRQLIQTASHLLGALDELTSLETPPPEEEVALVRLTRQAMATTFEVILPCGVPDAIAVASDALDEIDRLEDQLTVYRDTSAVSQLNRRAAGDWVQVEPGLFGLLALAQRLTAETEGAFDVSVGALIKAWGFYRRRGRVPSDDERAEVLPRTGMKNVLLDPERRAVRYAVRGLEINLGSIGKGYALDRAAHRLSHQWGVRNGLVHGGHSSVVALGDGDAGRRGWAVGVKHPWAAGRRLAVVRLRDRALATSAATFQHLEYNGRRLGHILDPRTGWPAEGLASATAIAPTAAEADALSTAFYIQGMDWACACCARRPDVGAILLPGSDGARPVVAGLAPADIDLIA